MTREVYSNCFLALLYMLLRGRVARLVIISGEPEVRFSFHLVALTRRGKALHFRHSLPHARNGWGRWWFLGRIVGVSCCRQIEQLRASDRRLLWETNRIRLVLAACIALWCLAAVPWLVWGSLMVNWFWVPCSIWFNAKWAWLALHRRRRGEHD